MQSAEEHFRGRGRARGGLQIRGRGKRGQFFRKLSLPSLQHIAEILIVLASDPVVSKLVKLLFT